MSETVCRRAVRSVGAVTLSAGLALDGASTAVAQPQSSLEPKLVEQFNDFAYTQLFAVGVQVYERVELQEKQFDEDRVLYTPILERLHSPSGGEPGSLRYGFIGSPLPEAFSSPGTFDKPSMMLGSGHISSVDPTTHETLQFLGTCVGDPNGGRPIGPLAGGSLATWCPS
ncbi:hypothetical protein [Dietzia sp.]|uniref:hypothetical protein n=1 Tax=Dietzia sp. TaxID=1871616 RepID=UPI002FD8EFB7